MKTILITGWSGFLGIRTTRLLLSKGYRVIGVSRKKPKRFGEILENSKFQFVQGDITHENCFAQVKKVDTIIHLAANSSAKKSLADPRYDLKLNILGTFNILEFCHKRNIHLILASTAKIYPIVDLAPRSFYGTSKLAADLYAQEFMLSLGVQVTINRFVTFYGPEQYDFYEADKSWVNWFLAVNIKNKPITIIGNGDQLRDPLYIDDAAELLLKEIEEERLKGKVFDVGAGKNNATTPKEIAREIERLTKIKFVKINKKAAKKDIKHEFIADIKPLHKFWVPRTSISRGLSATLGWMENQIY